ncbi:MAG TPA: hypothetical protein VFE64_13510, partial [Devosia sp.]|nr:hypothetical protein [Devosia sp.]
IALNAALVLQAIERFLIERNDQPVLDAMTYCFDTLYFDAMCELGTEIALEDVAPQRLVQREARVQNEDIEFLGTMKDRPWNAEEIRGLRRRADGRSLLGA